MTMHTRVSGVWKEIQEAAYRTGGVWKSITGGWVRVTGVWKQFFDGNPVPVFSFGETDIQIGTLNTTAPVTVLPGDILIHFGFTAMGGGALPAAAAPTGFTLQRTISNTTATHMRLCISTKICVGDEDGDTIVSGIDGDYDRAALVHYQLDSGETASISHTSTGEEGTVGNPSAQTVTASGATGASISYAVGLVDGASAPASLSLTGSDYQGTSGQGGNAVGFGLATVEQQVGGSNVTADMDDHGGQTLASGYFDIT